MSKIYIGENKVMGEFQVEGDESKVKLAFEGHPEITISRALYDLVKADQKYNGNVTDRICTTLATKFLSEMGKYGLEYNMIINVANFMQNLGHNLREELIKKKFGKGSNDLDIKEILSEPDTDLNAKG